MWDSIIEFFNSNEIASIALEFYLIFMIVFFCVRFFSKSKTALAFVIPLIIIVIGDLVATELNLYVAEGIFGYCKLGIGVIAIVVLAPEIKQFLIDGSRKISEVAVVKTTMDSKMAIADAVMFLSSKKIGALITIEKHRVLDQYADKAVQMDSDISKELLINIFTPLTPLHDGAVIIKGNKIRCAGAYYILSQRDNLDKTVGSRHRAALGIAEATDSVTIVVSEETGSISIAYSGIFMKMTDKNQLLEYVELAMEREV
ncbi:MAG: diadenylate cyclase CdaA [bacterium]